MEDNYKDVDVEKLSKLLNTSPDKGLSEYEVKNRILKYGRNVIETKQESFLIKFLKKFYGLTPVLLIITMLFSLFIGRIIDSIIILFLLILNAIISSIHDQKANKAVEMLKKKLSVKCLVVRDGNIRTVDSEEIVPGDVIILKLGNFVPADAKIIESENLEVDQSALTGESLPVEKKRNDIIYSGSIIKKGKCRAIVTRTGKNTYFGKTINLVKEARPKLHMEQISSRIINYLLLIISIMLILMFFFIYLRHGNILHAIPIALLLILFAIPVALPAMFTISMAVGSVELIKKGVLITKLSAVEDASTMDVICVDKTGTLTENKLTVAELISYHISEEEMLLYAYLASDEESGDPLDNAIIEYYRAKGNTNKKFSKIKFIPFDPSTRRTESIVDIDGKEYHIIKGAHEIVEDLVNESKETIEQDSKKLSSRGFRFLAVAYKNNGEWKYAGMIAFHDPIREDTPGLIAELKSMGIDVKMITGDAEPIAKEVGSELMLGERVINAREIRINKNIDPITIANRVEESNVVAEAYPEDKYVIVKALQSKNHIVGMTGDGVNDSPALKQAEVGIAVSNATDVAKSAASVVLTSPGLINIVDLIDTGRSIYQRIVTWVLNKIVKTFEVSFLIIIIFLLFNRFILSSTDILLFLFLIDFVTLSISTDNERGSKNPEKWNLNKLVKFSVIFGIVTLSEIFFTYIIINRKFSSVDEIHTFFFTLIMFYGLFTPLVLRERRHFWKSMPGRTMLLSIIADSLAVILLGVFGLSLIKPIGLDYVLLSLVIALFFTFIINDNIKILLNSAGISR